MRNALNDIEKIERYLRNQMSNEERSAFEKEMQNNPDLKKSVEEQQQLMKGMERIGMKKAATKAGFKYRLQKGLVNVGIPVLITTAITALILNWNSTKPETPNSKLETFELPSLNENGDSLWADADKYIPYQIFSIDNSKDTVIEGNDGTIVAIPANAFVDENGNVVKGKIDFELKEALKTETILKGGLTTTSNGELLETGGMFYLNARQDGKSLKLAEGKDIIADVPSDNTKTGMLLFDGERKEDGTINWVNPKPIEKPLVPVDIHTLNFYPPNYEDSLATMTEKASIKKFKDSVYYSFAHLFNYFNLDTINGISKNNESEEITIPSSNDLTIHGYNDIVNIFTNGGYKIMYSTEENLIPSVGSSKVEILRKERDLIFILSFDVTKNNFSNVSLQSVKYNYNIGSNKDFKPSFNGLTLPAVSTDSKKILFIPVQTRIIENASFQLSGSCTFQIDFWQNGTVKKFQKSLPINYFFSGYDMPAARKPFSGLNPAKVKAIWNDKFQNTLIATKEFEERMPFIHGLCSRGNNVLDIYVNNLDKRISTIDSMVAKTLSGRDKETFLKFAARGEGRVKMDNTLLNKLGEYYKEQTKKFTEASKLASDNYYKKHREANENAVNKQNKHLAKNQQRESENFNREFAINLQDAYRQLGYKPVRVTGGITVNVNSLGWKNVDKYVFEATKNRETMNYTDPFTGKTAVLKYEPLVIKVINEEQYDRVLVYLLPDQLNSFMRMKKEDGNYAEKLNMLFQHEIIVLAFKGEQGYFKKISDVQPGEITCDELELLSEAEINKQLSDLKKLNHTAEMKSDIAYQFFQQRDAKRKATFVKNEKLIKRIEKVIFPCGNYAIEELDIPTFDSEQEY